jgi:uncharacterized protein (TIGR02147 family)
MSQEHVFAFEDPVEYLHHELRERQKRDTRFSLRSWSRQLGYENPSYLSHVLNRKRRLKPELAALLAENLALRGRSRKYFDLIVLGQSAPRTEKESATLRGLVKAVRPRRYAKVNQLSLETFSLVSDWYHWAILEMTGLGGDLTVDSAHRRLGGRVDRKTVRSAIERLLRAKLLRRDETGRLRRATPDVNETHAPVPPEAVIAYHRQMGLLAVEAVSNQPRSERDFYGTTLSFRRENFRRAQQILEEAHKKVLTLVEHERGEEIYQLNTQFFRLSGPRRSKSK